MNVNIIDKKQESIENLIRTQKDDDFKKFAEQVKENLKEMDLGGGVWKFDEKQGIIKKVREILRDKNKSRLKKGDRILIQTSLELLEAKIEDINNEKIKLYFPTYQKTLDLNRKELGL